MLRDTRQQAGSIDEAEAVADTPAMHDAGQFTNAGPLPDVAEFATPPPTASERAFGDDFAAKLPPELTALIKDASPEDVGTLLDVHAELADPIVIATQQLRGAAFAQQAVARSTRMHKPAAPDKAAPAQTPTPQPIAPQPAPAPSDPQQRKHWERAKRAGFDQLTSGAPGQNSSMTEVRLPDNIVKQLDQAWRDSFVGKRMREQGGNLVRTSGPSYEIHREENESPHYYDNDESVGRGEKLVAQVHTHPYDKKDVPEGFASFSDGDFDSLMRSDANMSILRSGPYTFMLVKTKEFNAAVARTNNDEDKLKVLAKQMTDVYDAAFKATKGSFPEQIEAGVLAVCERFHLLYFVGQGADLVRKDKQSK